MVWISHQTSNDTRPMQAWDNAPPSSMSVSKSPVSSVTEDSTVLTTIRRRLSKEFGRNGSLKLVLHSFLFTRDIDGTPPQTTAAVSHSFSDPCCGFTVDGTDMCKFYQCPLCFDPRALRPVSLIHPCSR